MSPASSPNTSGSDDCPFCAISLAYPPTDPLTKPDKLTEALAPNDRTSLPTQMIYAGEYVLAFLDIQPMTKGHTLVIPRQHRVRMGDLTGDEGAEVCCFFMYVLRICDCLSIVYGKRSLGDRGSSPKGSHISALYPWDCLDFSVTPDSISHLRLSCIFTTQLNVSHILQCAMMHLPYLADVPYPPARAISPPYSSRGDTCSIRHPIRPSNSDH